MNLTMIVSNSESKVNVQQTRKILGTYSIFSLASNKCAYQMNSERYWYIENSHDRQVHVIDKGRRGESPIIKEGLWSIK